VQGATTTTFNEINVTEWEKRRAETGKMFPAEVLLNNDESNSTSFPNTLGNLIHEEFVRYSIKRLYLIQISQFNT
jgi:hypothetical protein